MINNKIFFILLILILSSCQKLEILEEIIFDYNQFPKISISAETKI